MSNVKRGDIYMADLDPVIGSEQGGIRPVVIVSNDMNNRNSTTFTGVPVTSRPKKCMPTHIRLRGIPGLPKDSIALTEQPKTLDEKRLGAYMGHAKERTMKKVSNGLKHGMDLYEEETKHLITLCPRCAHEFYEADAYIIRRADYLQINKDVCMFCNDKMGYDYYLTRRDAWHVRVSGRKNRRGIRVWKDC